MRLAWHVKLGPGEERELSWTIWSTLRPAADPSLDESTTRTELEALFPDVPRVSADEGAAAYHAWERGTTTVASDHELFNLVIKRSVADLRLLINDGPGPDQRYVAAGVPWFATIFGRDSLIASFQALPFRPQLAVETLTVLAAYQATELDPSRDMEPGKILHELRTGEMAGTGELPHTPYYGSVDSTPLWLILLGATYDWTGDADLVDRLWPNALAALDWIDRYGDRDGDGFIEYERQTDRGLVNQGWKDSSDAIRDRNGHDVHRPGRPGRGPGLRLRCQAAHRGARPGARRRGPGHDAWTTEADDPPDPVRGGVLDRGPALLRDGPRRGEAPGRRHRLERRPVPVDRHRRARAGARRHRPAPSPVDVLGLGHPDLRVPASPAINPIGYHKGTVWPHDTSLIAAGLKRYGFDDASNRLSGQVLEAAQRFPDYRLPELFCGFDRGEATTPVPYPVACSPQAWAAGASFLFLVDDARPARARGERRAGAVPPAPAGLAGQGDPDRPAGRRGVGRPAVPPLARARRAPRSCARSATSPSPIRL